MNNQNQKIQNKMPTVLLVEDDLVLAETYKAFCSDEPIDLIHVTTGAAVLDYLQQTIQNVIILDLMLPDMNGMDILKEVQQRQRACAIIIISAQTDVDIVVEAMRNGTFDYIEKPFKAERLLLTLHNALSQQVLYETIGECQHIYCSEYHSLIGASQPMQALYQLIDRVAATQASVFITGESGTGKELCAKAIHKQSQRKDKPFIVVNCAALPKELIESQLFGHVKGAFTGAATKRDGAAKTADGGTLFLDEIGEMDLALQSRLLRLVQSGTFYPVGSDKEEQVDIRLICATNRDIKADIKAGRFREDLYYRLNVIDIEMPALRTRGDDILRLARHFLSFYAQQENKPFQGFTEQAEQKLLDYRWPGNVRQLQHLIYKVVVLNNAPTVTAEMLPRLIEETASQSDNALPADNSKVSQANSVRLSLSLEAIPSLEEVEKEVITQVMALTHNNVTKTAKLLKIDPSRIYRKYRKLGLKIR